ncbi:ethyl acetate hydrolase-like [Mytilus galloprovincialis]|uniref:ethyl acetate hydrolase-like n=1 Tax=Mytilus edulis TaxID=6550 RepID=UPI0039EFB7EE
MAEALNDLKKKYKVHEETESYFKLRTENGNNKPYYEMSNFDEARIQKEEIAKQFGGEVEFEGSVKDFTVPSPYVKDGVRITVYRSKNCALVVAPSVFVYFHGGGNVVGSRKTVDTVCKIFSRDAPCVVVNVEYRCGPEHKYPANHEDAVCVVRWVKMNKGLIGAVNESTVGVGGDSAGGRLAASVCHEEYNINYQVLVYPSLDYRRKFNSDKEFEKGPVLSSEVLQWFNRNYINEADFEKPRASPLLYKSFNKCPPALIIMAELDMNRDHGYAYHEKLKEAGVKSQTFTVKGVTHGFFVMPGHFKECCQRAHEKVSKFIKANS